MDPRGSAIPPSLLDISEETRRIALNQALRLKQALRQQQQTMHRTDSTDSETDEVAAPMDGTTLNGAPAKKQELVVVDPSEIGMEAITKTLYSSKEDKRGRFLWQDTIPEDLGKPAEDAESSRKALICRMVKVHNDPTKVLAVHSIVVQSPLLKTLLGEVLEGYPGVTVSLKRLEFSGRFEPLIHRWDELSAAIERLRAEKDSEDADSQAAARLEHGELLQGLLATEFKDTIDASLDMKTLGVTTYEHIWTLFQPGSLVYTKVDGQDRVFRLAALPIYGKDRDGNPVFWLNLQYVDYDGSHFGTQKLNTCIGAFEGTKSISSLTAVPLDFHSRKDEISAKLIERGAKVERFAGSHYVAYNGVGWRLDHQGLKDKYNVKGRVVIDGYGWNRFNPNHYVYLNPINVNSAPTAGRPGGGVPPLGSNIRGHIAIHMFDAEDAGIDDGGMPMDGFFADENDETSKPVPLTDEQRLICTPLVRGYALKEKQWLNFFVNAVHEVEFNTRAFESLVLPNQQKELVLSFTATQQSYRTQFDDVIDGKGRGIILLLAGPPGVGKTLTAESVAEEMKAPLFLMSAGDLGLDPRSVESKLQGVLDMCVRWNAILLIDEADVFLEERSLHELERNKLVSIFLRVLEYYEGIMFLTTNRVQTFDQAFQSRIHIQLEYKELDAQGRKKVWANFLKQHNITQAAVRERPLKPLPSAAKTNGVMTTSSDPNAEQHRRELHMNRTLPHEITSKDIDKLCEMPLNGRQIKNMLKTAQLLATHKGEGLKRSHIETAMDVTQHLHNANRESERAKSSLFY